MSTTGITEGVETPAEGLSKLVVGHVLSQKMPDTHLHLCQVDTGDAEGPRQIACGAPNVTAGIKVIVAIPGARIADNHDQQKKRFVWDGISRKDLFFWQNLDFQIALFLRNLRMVSKFCQKMPSEIASSHILTFDDEIIELSITLNRADAFYAWCGHMKSSSIIYGKSVHFQKNGY